MLHIRHEQVERTLRMGQDVFELWIETMCGIQKTESALLICGGSQNMLSVRSLPLRQTSAEGRIYFSARNVSICL